MNNEIKLSRTITEKLEGVINPDIRQCACGGQLEFKRDEFQGNGFHISCNKCKVKMMLVITSK